MAKKKVIEKSEIDLLREINLKLGLLVSLGLEEKDKGPYIIKLRKAGLDSKTIGDLLGVSDSTVRNYK